MTLGKARSTVALLWVMAAIPLIMLFVVQTILGKYSNEWDTPWNWFLPLVGPILTLIVAAWITDPKFESDEVLKSKNLFIITTLFSVLYLAALYAVVLLHPVTTQPIKELFRSSGWYLGVIQMFVVLTLHRFLIVNI